MVMKHFELDPIYYLGIPGLSFDIMLKMFQNEERKDEEEISPDLMSKTTGLIGLVSRSGNGTVFLHAALGEGRVL